MNGKKLAISNRFILGVIILLSVSVAIFNGLRRNTYHVDEVWSYGFSNSINQKFFYDWWINGDIPQEHVQTFESFFDNWQSGDFFRRYVTVQKGEEFRYDIPYKYQTTDVSPPLYYLLLHTICSFFPEKFSVWYGLIPNIIFFAFCILFLYCIGVKIFKNEKQALFAVAFWAFSRAAFSDVNYVRMYMLETLIVLISFWLHLKIIEVKSTYAYLPIILIVNVLGFLTHNYVYVITFFMASIVCVILFIRSEIKKILIFSITELSSVAISFFIFPSVITQMTRSGYTNEFMNSTIDRIFSVNYLKFFNITINSITGIDTNDYQFYQVLLPFIIVAFIIASIFLIFSNSHTEFTFLFLTSFLSGYIVACVSPYMRVYESRYFFALLPLSYMALMYAFISMMEYLIDKYHWKRSSVTFINIFLVMLSIMGNFYSYNHFLFYEKGQRNLGDILSKQYCVVFQRQKDHYVHVLAPWLSEADKAYVTYQMGELGEAIDSVDSCYLMIDKTCSKSRKNEILTRVDDKFCTHCIGLYVAMPNELNYHVYYLQKKYPSEEVNSQCVTRK